MKRSKPGAFRRISALIAAGMTAAWMVTALPAFAEEGDALMEAYVENQSQDPGRFRNAAQLAQASGTLDSVIHNPRYDDCEKRQCIDVSKFQGDIDWNLVAADGIDQAIIRIGFRGYGNGALAPDPKYQQNLEGAAAAGLDTGVYFFTQAITVEEAIEEADYVLSMLGGFALTMPVFIDVEMITYDTARLDEANLTPAQQTEICRAFCSTIEAGGYQAGVYANKYYMQNMLFADELAQKYTMWLANYTTETSYMGEYQIWQYSENGVVNGINHAVDMNVSYSRKVSYAADSLTIHAGQSISPVLSGDNILSYRSSDPQTATVDRKGVITGLREGDVTVTAVSSNGSSDTIHITITEDPSFRINYADMIYSYTANPIPGDSNFDGQINASDASQMLILAAQNGSGSGAGQIDGLQQISFDYNNDGVINASDASCVLVYSAMLGAGN